MNFKLNFVNTLDVKPAQDISHDPLSRQRITEKKTSQLSRDVTGCSVKVRQRNCKIKSACILVLPH